MLVFAASPYYNSYAHPGLPRRGRGRVAAPSKNASRGRAPGSRRTDASTGVPMTRAIKWWLMGAEWRGLAARRHRSVPSLHPS
jgi:hypothetical protein